MMNQAAPMLLLLLLFLMATELNTTEYSQTTTETLLTTSVIPSGLSSSLQDFLIYGGSVLGSFLMFGILYAVIFCFVKICPKSKKGDNDCHHVYDDFQQKQKARDTTIEMQEEVSEVTQYPSVIHGNQLSLGDSTYTNTEMEHKLGSDQVPIESVEYSSIAKSRHQLPQ